MRQRYRNLRRPGVTRVVTAALCLAWATASPRTCCCRRSLPDRRGSGAQLARGCGWDSVCSRANTTSVRGGICQRHLPGGLVGGLWQRPGTVWQQGTTRLAAHDTSVGLAGERGSGKGSFLPRKLGDLVRGVGGGSSNRGTRSWPALRQCSATTSHRLALGAFRRSRGRSAGH